MAYQDLENDWTEVDAHAGLLVEGNKVTCTELTANEDSYLYRDFGVDYFNGDFEMQFEVTVSVGDAVVVALGMTNEIDDWFGTAQGISTYVGSTISLAAQGTATGGTHVTYWYGELSTKYYCTWVRDWDAGIGGTGVLYLFIRTGSHTGTLVHVCSVELKDQVAYRYLYFPQCLNNWNSTPKFSGVFENLDIDPAVSAQVHGYESLADYTEFDVTGLLTNVTDLTLHGVDMPANVKAYFTADKGAGYFNGDFTIELMFKRGGTASVSYSCAATCSNLPNEDMLTIWGSPSVGIYTTVGGPLRIFCYGESLVIDSYVSLTSNVWYYVRFVRDADGGGSGAGRYTLYVYSDRLDGNLLDTLVVDSDLAANFRYFYHQATYDGGLVADQSAYTSNIKLIVPAVDGQIMSSMAYAGMHNVIIGGVILR